jgi:hypothetical protein
MQAADLLTNAEIFDEYAIFVSLFTIFIIFQLPTITIDLTG